MNDDKEPKEQSEESIDQENIETKKTEDKKNSKSKTKEQSSPKSKTKKTSKVKSAKVESKKETATKQQKNVTLSKRNMLIAGGVILVVVIVLSFLVPSLLLQSKNKSTEADRVISKVQNILIVPKDSDPTVISVDNPVMLMQNNPQFYKDVQAGDYLLMYSTKAVIYRESINKIVNIAPISE